MYAEPWLDLSENHCTPVNAITWHAAERPQSHDHEGTLVLRFDDDARADEAPHSHYKRLEHATQSLDDRDTATVVLGLRTPRRSKRLARDFANTLPVLLPDRAVTSAAHLHSVATGRSSVHLRGGNQAIIAAAYIRVVGAAFDRVSVSRFETAVSEHADYVEHNKEVFQRALNDETARVLCGSPTFFY